MLSNFLKRSISFYLSMRLSSHYGCFGKKCGGIFYFLSLKWAKNFCFVCNKFDIHISKKAIKFIYLLNRLYLIKIIQGFFLKFRVLFAKFFREAYVSKI